jgi:hypothetical protein
LATAQFVDAPRMRSWYAQYLHWLPQQNRWNASSQLTNLGTPVSPDVFYSSLQDFLSESPGAQFGADIVWLDDADPRRGLAATVMHVTLSLSAQSAATHDLHSALSSLRAVCALYPALSAFPFADEFFAIEADDSVRWEIGRALLVAVCASLVMLLMLAPVLVALLVFLLLGVMAIDALGVLSLWGLDWNAWSALPFLAFIALSLSFLVPVAMEFMTARGDPRSRAVSAFERQFPLLAFTALLEAIALIFLSGAQAYPTFLLFVVYSLLLLLALWHALFVLPILLPFVSRRFTVAADGDTADYTTEDIEMMQLARQQREQTARRTKHN